MARPSPLDGLRILIAEDNVFTALELEQMVRDFGCEPVGPVATVEEALRMARGDALDGAILDVNLRDQSIFPAAQELVRRGIPIIFASGYEDNYVFPDALAACPRLQKPFLEDELKRMAGQTFGRQ